MENSLLRKRQVEDEEENGDLAGRVWEESKKVWRVAFPGMLVRVTSYGTFVITQSFIGHISSLDLAAYALVHSLIVRFADGILLGMSSAIGTLCGQAYGAGQYHILGIYLQKSWILDLIIATILVPLFVFATPIFNLLQEEPAIAGEARTISLWFIPSLYTFVFSLTMQMYLQAQFKNMILGLLCALSLVIHILLSWLFVSVLNLGVSGAMGALTVSSVFVVLGEFVYVLGGWCPLTWRGFTKAAFVDLWPIAKLSASSGLMLCLDLWYSAVLVLVAGYTSHAEVSISAFSICLNITALMLMLFIGFFGAACVRVANELGRGHIKAAKFSIKIIMTTSFVIGLVFCILCLIFNRQIPYLFTSTQEVADTVSDLSILLAFTILLNSIQPVLTGVATGAGFQSEVALLNVICYYVIGVPLAILLAFVAKLGVKGIWIAMICGMSTQVLALGFKIWRLDWDEQVKKASERVDKLCVNPSKGPDNSVNHT